MENTKASETKLPESLATELEAVIEQWDQPDLSERKRLDEARQEFQERANEISQSAAETERLDASDFAFRINATR